MLKTQHTFTKYKLLAVVAVFASLPLTGMAETATTLTATGTPMTAQTASTTTATSSQTQASTTSSMPKSIMIMKHICNPSIKNVSDFEAVEAGNAPVARLAATVLACPTTGLPGNLAASGTVASPRTTYDFILSASSTPDLMLSSAMFMQHKLCESDIAVDVNADGMISTSTCLDISHYAYTLATTTTGHLDVKEKSPLGTHMGALRFTPKELSPNNDSASLVMLDIPNSTIHLNVASDTDGMLMLHAYNFLDTSTSSATTTQAAGTSTIPTTGTTTTSTSTVPVTCPCPTPVTGTSTTPTSGTTTVVMGTSTDSTSMEEDTNKDATAVNEDNDNDQVENSHMHRRRHHRHAWRNNDADTSDAANTSTSTEENACSRDMNVAASSTEDQVEQDQQED